MGNTFRVVVDGWVLEFKVRDDGLQAAVITDKNVTHYVRMCTADAEALRDYLHMNLPISA
jgi:hypothetical protein